MQHEPWLRGPIAGVHPLLAPALFSFQQAREDLARWAGPLGVDDLWRSPHGAASVGFHIRHMAGSVDRLMTYIQGRMLDETQMSELRDESRPLNIPAAELLSHFDRTLAAAEGVVRALDPERLGEPRSVGRKALPTTVAGLLTHVAEHTQRHLGQAITTAKWIRSAEQA